MTAKLSRFINGEVAVLIRDRGHDSVLVEVGGRQRVLLKSEWIGLPAVTLRAVRPRGNVGMAHAQEPTSLGAPGSIYDFNAR
jgi:hypothetical protein